MGVFVTVLFGFVILLVATAAVAVRHKNKFYAPVMSDYPPRDVIEIITTEMVGKGATIVGKTQTTATFSGTRFGRGGKATIAASPLHGQTKVVTSGEGELRWVLKQTVDQQLVNPK